jgi:hypothetical protein
MKRRLDLPLVRFQVLVVVSSLSILFSQQVTLANTIPPVIEWRAVLGGPGCQLGEAVVQEADDGYVLVGYSLMDILSLYLVRAQADGTLDWERTFGDTWALGAAVEQTLDGGYVAVGREGAGGQTHLYLVRVNDAGNPLWEQRYGGEHIARGYCVKPSSDGGYLAGGWIDLVPGSSAGNQIEGYLVKTDPNGEVVWEGRFGGLPGGQVTSLLETRDGDYVVAGNTATPPDGGWLLNYLGKWSASGEAIWERVFDRSGIDRDPEDYRAWFTYFGARDPRVVELPGGGGYVLAGIVGPERETIGLFWFDVDGRLVSQRTTRGPGEFLDSFDLTADGGFLLGGVSRTPQTRRGEIHLVRLDASGDVEWELRLAGSDSETGAFARPTRDGGFIVVATDGPNDETPEDRYDVHLIKLSPETQVEKRFVRADSNSDASVDVSDAVSTLSWLFLGGPLGCEDAADSNDDGRVDIADPIYCLAFLFTGGLGLPFPYPDSGVDPTPDALGCQRY